MSRQFYVWTFGDLDRDRQKPPILANHRSFDQIEFQEGVANSRPAPCAEFTATRKRLLVDYQFNIPGFPLFSSRLREALASFGIDHIVYSDARLSTKAGALISDDYKVGNVVSLVSCFDWEHSICDAEWRDIGHASDIEKLVLRPEALEGHHLVRMEENSLVLLVSKELKCVLQEQGITGIDYVRSEDYEQ